MDKGVYYNHSGYYDGTAGTAIVKADRERGRFYNSGKWKRCRESFLKSKNYICERCGGIATLVHHKVHITSSNVNNYNITLDWNNLEALCVECHNFEHKSSKPTAVGIYFDSDGNVKSNTPPVNV